MAQKELRIRGAQPHLATLFVAGEMHTVVAPDPEGGEPIEIEVWLARPSTAQSTKSIRAARVEQARRRLELTSEDSDESMALDVQVGEMTKKELVLALVERRQRQFEQQAYHEILYGEDSTWGPDGEKYLDLLDMIIARMEEIEDNNREIKASDLEEGLINPVEDDEILRLNKEQAKFEKQVRSRVEALLEAESVSVSRRAIDDLRRELKGALVDAECDVVWYSEFRRQMLYHAVRFPDKHTTLYFSNPDQLDDLPERIVTQLQGAYERLDLGAEQTKNLLTPLPS